MAARRLPFAALGFSVAAALCSWNPLSAPFAVVVGLVTAIIAVRAALEGARRRVAVTALVVALGAAGVGGLVLGRTAGLGRRGPGEAVVTAPPEAQVEAELDAAEERTRAARERALGELKGVEESGTPGTAPGGPRRAPDGAGQR